MEKTPSPLDSIESRGDGGVPSFPFATSRTMRGVKVIRLKISKGESCRRAGTARGKTSADRIDRILKMIRASASPGRRGFASVGSEDFRIRGTEDGEQPNGAVTQHFETMQGSGWNQNALARSDFKGLRPDLRPNLPREHADDFLTVMRMQGNDERWQVFLLPERHFLCPCFVINNSAMAEPPQGPLVERAQGSVFMSVKKCVLL